MVAAENRVAKLDRATMCEKHNQVDRPRPLPRLLMESIEPQVEEFNKLAETSFWFRWGRCLVLNLCRIVRWSPVDESKLKFIANQEETGAHEAQAQRYGKLIDLILNRKASWAFRIYLSLLMTSILHAMWNVYHQYILDANLFKLNFLILRQAESPNNDPELDCDIQRLNSTVLKQRQLLALSGAPCPHLSFAVEVLYIIEIIIPIVTYSLPQYYMPLLSDVNIYFGTILIDYKRQLLLSQDQVREQVGRFLSSSQNFRRIFLGSLAVGHLNEIHQRRRKEDEIVELVKFSWHLEEFLCHTARRNQLMPLNTAPRWIFNWIPQWVPFITSCFVYALIFDAYFVYMLFFSPQLSERGNWESHQLLTRHPWWLLATIRHTSPHNHLYMPRKFFMCTQIVESLIILMSLNITSIHYGCIFFGSILDMGSAADKLRARFSLFVRLDSQRLGVAKSIVTHADSTKKSSSRQDSEDVKVVNRDRKQHKNATNDRDKDQARRQGDRRNFISKWKHDANRELLHNLMLYRVFVRQLKSLQAYFTLFMWTCLVITLMVPVITRLHVPYFKSNQDAKSFFITLSMLIITPATLCLIPPCRFYKQCLDLHKSMMHLLAHVIHVGGHEQFRDHYDKHLISVLRREINLNSDQACQQFPIRIGLISLSYTSVMKIYFWFGIVLASIAASASPMKGGHTMVGLLSDPFNVYSY